MYVLSGPVGVIKTLLRNQEADVEIISEKIVKGTVSEKNKKMK